METDPTEETIKKEVAEAVRILRDDGMHIHRTYERYSKTKTPPEADPQGDPAGGPPPPKTPPEDQPKPKKAGIWWGDRED